MKVSGKKVAEHRAALLATARRLLQEQGFDGAGVAEISREAGLTQGALYGQFKSKGALAKEAVCKAFADGAASWRELREAAPDALSAYLDAYLCQSHGAAGVCWRRVSRTCRDRTNQSARLLPKASGTWSRSSRTPFLKGLRKRWHVGARSPWSRRWSEASPWRAPWRKPIRSCPGRSSRPPGKNSAILRSAIIEAPHRRAVRGAEKGPLRHDNSGRQRPACQSADCGRPITSGPAALRHHNARDFSLLPHRRRVLAKLRAFIEHVRYRSPPHDGTTEIAQARRGR